LIAEARGELDRAIEHREHEIALIRKLRRSAATSPSWEFILHGYQVSDFSDRLDLLALLYWEAGDLDKAVMTLRKSARWCKEHCIRFDGRSVLRDCLQERVNAKRLDATKPRSRNGHLPKRRHV
jgi:hypothetical protein